MDSRGLSWPRLSSHDYYSSTSHRKLGQHDFLDFLEDLHIAAHQSAVQSNGVATVYVIALPGTVIAEHCPAILDEATQKLPYSNRESIIVTPASPRKTTIISVTNNTVGIAPATRSA